MAVGVPAVANGECGVLRGHCERSGAGIVYTNEEEFHQAIDKLQYYKIGFDNCYSPKPYFEGVLHFLQTCQIPAQLYHTGNPLWNFLI